MRLIDIYILRRVSMPLFAAVGIAMAALLMQRLVHLLDLFANRGSPLSIIMKMLGNLVPFYLAVALPAAFFIGVLYAGSRLSGDSELDAMRASGLSLKRLMVPILALAFAMMIVSSYLLGFLEPYTRFGYRALVHLVTDTQWDSAIERGAFFTGFGGKTILIGDISQGGRELSKIFVKEQDSSGNSIVFTAEHGDLVKRPDLSLSLVMRNGIRSETSATGDAIHVMTYDRLELPLDTVAPDPFRPRGEKESELTIFELIYFYFHPPDYLDVWEISSEINERAVRTVSIFFLPFLALPVGISSRRTSKAVRMAVGILFLVLYYEVLEFAQSVVRKGEIGPLLGFWLPCLIFASCSLWLFWLAERRPGEDPLAYLFDSLSSVSAWLRRRLPRFRRRATK